MSRLKPENCHHWIIGDGWGGGGGGDTDRGREGVCAEGDHREMQNEVDPSPFLINLVSALDN